VAARLKLLNRLLPAIAGATLARACLTPSGCTCPGAHRQDQSATWLSVDDTWVRRMPTSTGTVAMRSAEPVPTCPLSLPPQAHSRPAALGGEGDQPRMRDYLRRALRLTDDAEPAG
jgi:hypothetical protein